MKKIMALALVAMMVLCSMVVFADDAVVTDGTEVETISNETDAVVDGEEVVEGEEAPADGEEVVEGEEAPVDGEEVPVDGAEVVEGEEAPAEVTSTIIMIQINNKIMFKNDEQIELDVPAQLINDRTLVPMRAIFEALGATVSWDDATWTAIGEKDGVVVQIAIDSNIMYVGEEAVEIDVPAQLVEERTLVPVRAISEAFGCTVTWDDETETAIIKVDAPVADAEVPVDGAEVPVDGAEVPVDGEEAPAEGEEAPVDGEEVVEGEEAPADGEEVVEGEEAPADGEEVVEGEETPAE